MVLKMAPEIVILKLDMSSQWATKVTYPFVPKLSKCLQLPKLKGSWNLYKSMQLGSSKFSAAFSLIEPFYLRPVFDLKFYLLNKEYEPLDAVSSEYKKFLLQEI